MKRILSLLFILPSINCTAQPGTLDNSFGTGGKVIENYSAPYRKVIDMLLQADGKIIVLAEADYNSTTRVVLVRYNSNGTVDNTFSGDGIVDGQVVQPGEDMYPLAIRLQADGKILVCGSTYSTIEQGFVLRYNTTGDLDSSFAGTGMLTIQNPGISVIKNLVVLSNGQIVLVSSTSASAAELVLIKLNSNGSTNNGFGVNGMATINASGAAYPNYTRIEVQADGKFIVGGNPYDYNGDDGIDFILVRINANGTIDNTYGTNGIYTIPSTTQQHNKFMDLAIRPDGKVIASGLIDRYYQADSAFITRINTNGTKDNTFGINGIQTIDNLTNSFVSSGHVSLQTDGKILLTGFAVNAFDNYNIAVARFNAGGQLDGTFDGDGIALLQVNNYGSYGIASAQQSDGKIIITGVARSGDNYSLTIGRLTAMGATDNTISAGSTAIVPVGTGSYYENGNDILVQADQKIVSVRSRDNGYETDIGLSRHLPNGNIDSSFGINGRYNKDLPGTFYTASNALFSNGKIMVAGLLFDFLKAGQIGILRFNANGTPDSAYGTNGSVIFGTNYNAYNSVNSTTIQPDGKVVISTYESVFPYNNGSNYLLRLNASGGYDNTFNGNGKMLLPDTANYGAAYVQPDGKILLLLNSTYFGHFTYLKRLNANGTIDNSFNGGVTLETGLYNPNLSILPNGKIVLADDSIVARLNSNGSFDNTFDTDGIAKPGYRFTDYTNRGEMQVQTDGKILISGTWYNANSGDYGYQVVRINNTGSLDSLFGTNGIAFVPVATPFYNISAMALQADGKILLNGAATNSISDNQDFVMFRLNSNNVTPGITYTFTGNGAWNDPANWSNNSIPPATLPAGSTILIDPIAGGECVLTITQHVSSGATFTVKAGKNV